MKKTLFLLFLTTSFTLFSQNQLKLGFDTGYTYTSLNADLSNQVDAKYIARYGFGANLSAEYSICESLFVSSGISFLQKNYQYKRTNSRDGWYTNFNNNHLSSPLLIGAYIFNDPQNSNGFWMKVAAGMYMDYWLTMHREGRYPSFYEIEEEDKKYNEVSEKYDWKENENQFRRFGYGLQGQVQTGYSIGKYDVLASYNYQFGLSDQSKGNSIDKYKMKTKNYMLSLGIAYKFK